MALPTTKPFTVASCRLFSICQVNDVRDRFQAAQLIQKIFRGHFVRASPRSVVKRAQVLRKARVTGKLLLLKGTKRDLTEGSWWGSRCSQSY